MARSAIAFLFCLLGAGAYAAEIADVPMTNDRGETALVIDIQLKPGTEDVFEEAILRAVRCTRLEPGNLVYNIHKVYKTDGRYVLYEVWRSVEQFKAHLERPYAKRLQGVFDLTLAKPLDQSIQFLGDFAPDLRLDPISTDPARMAECK